MLKRRGIEEEILISHSLFTPSCGLGYVQEGFVEEIFSLTERMGKDAFVN